MISSTFGAAEAAGTYTVATVVQGDNPDLTPTTINAALGCTTSGIATGFEARFVPSAAAGFVDLAPPARRTHLLYGDATGGGHLWPRNPGKTPLP